MATKWPHPNPENVSEEALLIAMKASPRQRGFVRMMAIHRLMKGFEFELVASFFDITTRTLSSWVQRFNNSGVDGLLDNPRSGRPRKITDAHSAELEQVIENPQQAGETHWTARKFQGYLRQELQIEAGYTTVLRWLKEKGFRLKVPRPWPDRQDEEAREAFVERIRAWLQDDEIDLWFCDEMGVEGDPRPRRRWSKKGTKPTVTKNGDHVRMNVTGVVCPRTGQFYALEFTHTDREVFQVFLEHANKDIRFARRRNLLILDNASWHKCKNLDWGRFECVFLPPYSPDLNPIERMWRILKAEWFTDFIAKTHEQLVDRLSQALCWAVDRVDDNKRTTAIKQEL